MAIEKSFRVKKGLIVGDVEVFDSSGSLQASSLGSISSTDVTEGTNLYYTTTRADSDIADYLTGSISTGNITTTGYIRGPSTFTIDPATHGDDTGTLVVAGNLQVDGTTTTINSTTLTVDDKNIVLASGALNAAAADGAGITIDGASATLTYNSTPDAWSFNKSLGIGTTSPDYNFHITDTGDTIAAVTAGASSVAALNLGNSTNKADGGIRYDNSADALIFRASNAEKMRIDSSGRLSINTTAATELLNVANTAGNGAGVEFAGNGNTVGSTSAFYGQGSGSDAYVWNRANNPVLLGTNNTERMRITSSGNLLVGTTSDQSRKVQINGTLALVDAALNSIADILINSSGVLGISPYNGGGSTITFNTNPSSSGVTERMRIGSSGELYLDGGTSRRPFASPSNWGYSASYRAIVLGSASTTYNTEGTGSVTLSFNYNPSGNTSGIFNGDGREIIFRNGTQFVTPNAADTNFNLYNLVLKDGNVGIGINNPPSLLHIAHDGHGIGFDYVGATLPGTAGLFTSSSALTESAYGDLNIKARSDYGGYYGIGFFVAPSGGLVRAGRFKSNGSFSHDNNGGVSKVRPDFSQSLGSYSAGQVTVMSGPTNDENALHTFYDIGSVRTRGFGNYVDFKTNLTSDNIMFMFKFEGFQYNRGNAIFYGGGYTYQGGVIAKSIGTAQKVIGSLEVYDIYRASDGSLCVKLFCNTTGYDEGKTYVGFHSHGAISSVRIVAAAVTNSTTNYY